MRATIKRPERIDHGDLRASGVRSLLVRSPYFHARPLLARAPPSRKAQNEPGYVASYDSCVYDGPSLADFIGDHPGPAFDDAGLLDDRGNPLRIIARQTQRWARFSAFENAIEASPAALGHADTIASHSYNGAPSRRRRGRA